MLEIGSNSNKVKQQVVGSSNRALGGSNRKDQLQWAVGHHPLYLVGGSNNLLLQSCPKTQFLDQLEVKAGWGKERGTYNKH